MTNQEAFAEEIKTMNPYELARRLNQDCKFCPAWDYCNEHSEIKMCTETVISWLKDEVKAHE